MDPSSGERERISLIDYILHLKQEVIDDDDDVKASRTSAWSMSQMVRSPQPSSASWTGAVLTTFEFYV